MRDYGVVSPKFWTGETGKLLRKEPQAQLLAMYLMTSPHSNMLGVYYCPVMYMAHESGLDLEGASKALARLIELGFCTFDEASETVFVKNMAAYQIADQLKADDKRVLGIRRDVEKMPEGAIKSEFIATYSIAFHLINSPPCDSPLEGPCKTLLSQEQDQEQDQDQQKRTTSLSAAKLPPCPHQEILDLYAERLPMLPQPKAEAWGGQRAKHLAARWKWLLTTKKKKTNELYAANADEALAWLGRYFVYVSESDFLSGRTGKFTGCDLGWLVNEENFAKVMQGNYENKESAA
jgi:hypothetical protein